MRTNTGRWPTIPALTVSAAERFADRTAIIDGPQRLSFGQLGEAAAAFGAALVASGVEPGDRVAIWAPNCVEWVIAFLGLSSAGAVLIPVSTRFKGAEAFRLLSRGRVRVLVTVNGFLGNDYVAVLGDRRAELPDLRTVVVARGAVPAGTEGWSGFMGRGTHQAIAEVKLRQAAMRTDDAADILFTSGTTGVAKGVVMSHRASLRVGTDWVDMVGLQPSDRYLMINPYFHMFGLKSGILASLSIGTTMYPEAVFEVDKLLARVEAERVTALPATPAVYQAMLDHPGRGRYDISSLRLAVTGGADIPVELIRRMREELPFSTIVSGYGLTEGGTAAATRPDDRLDVIATTVGWPRPSYEIRIADPAGGDVPAGQAGEVWLRGGSIMSHYLDDPLATAAVLTPDGWLRTGDLGVHDQSGRLRIAGRMKDMFIVGGFNAYPAEIENALLCHPHVSQAAVIGVPDYRLGEVGMAFVVLRTGSSSTAAEIIAWCWDEMANYKVPRALHILDRLPLNASGKVVKTVLRDHYATGGNIARETEPVPSDPRGSQPRPDVSER